MKKVAENMDFDQHKPATPEQIEEYKKLKMRNEWIKFNEKKLNEIEREKTRFARLSIFFSLMTFIVCLINLIMIYYEKT